MTLVHPQMLTQLTKAGHYPSICDVQARAAGVDAHGVANGVWADAAGLTGISCSVNASPYMGGALSRQEFTTFDKTVTTELLRIALAGRYDAITTAMRAVVGGVVYNIKSVDEDSHGILTSLLVERVTT
jgi:head-tail adaptor